MVYYLWNQKFNEKHKNDEVLEYVYIYIYVCVCVCVYVYIYIYMD
jgi:hypothetical protein